MKRSYYIYNNGTLKRKDNSIAFIDEEGERKYIPIETVNEIYVMSEMDFNTNLSPCVIHPISGDSYLYLVLPVKTSNS